MGGIWEVILGLEKLSQRLIVFKDSFYQYINKTRPEGLSS